MNFIKISWEKYQKNCIVLAKKIQNSRLKINRIVVISRGGLVAGRILSDLLKLPISHITVSSYTDLKQKKDIKITEVPKKIFSNEALLLVDEISDSGRTFKRASSYFLEFSHCKIYTLALYIKPKTQPKPDFYLDSINGWVIFPYEVKETCDAFIKIFRSSAKAKKKMLEIGFKDWEIS